jgi:hypothetical protein
VKRVLPVTLESIIPSWWVGTMSHGVLTALIQYSRICPPGAGVTAAAESETNSACAPCSYAAATFGGTGTDAPR